MEKKDKRLEVKAGREYIILLGEQNPFDGSYPTESVTELVRCKDCKHRPTGDYDAPHDENGESDYTCPCLNQSDSYYSWIPDDDWFCADGERKDGDENGECEKV